MFTRIQWQAISAAHTGLCQEDKRVETNAIASVGFWMVQMWVVDVCVCMWSDFMLVFEFREPVNYYASRRHVSYFFFKLRIYILITYAK